MRRGTALAIICGVLTLWAPDALPAEGGPKRVVLLFDERPSLPGLAAIEASFTKTLTANSSDHVEIYHEDMDLSRFGTDAHQIQLRDFLKAKYAAKPIDVAVAVLGPSLDFLLSHGDAIFPGTPIVFLGVDRREIRDRSLPAHVGGVFVKRRFGPTVEIALGLHPGTQRIVVVAGTSKFDTSVLEEARKELQTYEGRVAMTYLTHLPMQQLLREVSKLPSQTIVLFTTFFQDGTGEPFVPHDVVNRLSAAANAPIYGFVDQYLGRGLVGGSLYSFAQQGPEAAKLALGILKRERVSPAPLLEPELSQLLFDWRQLQRWGISESRLPSGSEIRFRPLTVWEAHRTFVLAVGGVVASLATISIALLIQIARRKKAEVSLRESEERLEFSAASTNTGLWQYEVGTRRLWATEQSRAMFGLNPKSASNPEAFFRAVHPHDRAIVAAGIRSVWNSPPEPRSMEFRVVGANGHVHWLLAMSKLHLNGEGKPHSISGVFRDITARKVALFAERRGHVAALRESTTRLRSSLDAANVIAWDVDLVRNIAHSAGPVRRLLDRPEGPVPHDFSAMVETIHPEERDSVMAQFWAAVSTADTFRVEFRLNSHRLRWVTAEGSIERDADGRPVRLRGITHDVTERKRAEEQQHLLVAELDHRVKNVLATVQAVAAQTLETSGSMQHFVAALDGRLRSMGSTHELLSDRRWLGIPLADLVERQLAPYTTGSNTEIAGPELMLSAEASQTMAMALHELATNAAKYGALSRPRGRVSVRWGLGSNGSEPGTLGLEWQEEGGPVVTVPAKAGFGTAVIRNLIPYELGGTIDHVLAPQGARCRMEIPLARLCVGGSETMGLHQSTH